MYCTCTADHGFAGAVNQCRLVPSIVVIDLDRDMCSMSYSHLSTNGRATIDCEPANRRLSTTVTEPARDALGGDRDV